MSDLRALLVGSGPVRDAPFLRRTLRLDRDDWLVVAADGGSVQAVALGLTPHVHLGDFDSAAALPSSRHTRTIRFPPDKDETDLELAFAHVATRPDVTEIVVVGGIDGRFDHALTNVNVGCRYAVEGHPVSFVDGGYRLRPVTRYLSLVRTSRFDTVSLIPHSDVVEGVTTRGLVFPLADEPLFRSRGRGVSNRFASARASVRVRTGVLVVLETSSVS